MGGVVMISRQLPILVSGVLFGAGLTLGGMTDPARVRGFLDLFGDWDPTLAFVMGGAVIVMAIAWWLQPKLARPLFADAFALPSRRDLTPKLIGGSALFGIGWGVAGLCPGPGVAALVIEPVSAAIFVTAMLAGMFLVRLTESDT
ncbi:YeeE/YedE family protein [Erythrobacter insulae]|uniref:YeeE/YedE family protein n=2 Tax=Erythrobacter insulae TaxID=2584124 RepID=A0A547PCC6_9SPHN|nr:YeeE/YedE family protein [Erythrobacter insulae]